MRHRKNSVKLGRKTQHREAMMANLAVSLITHGRIKTTEAKARALRPYAEKLVTLGKKATLHSRRLAVSRIKSQVAVRKLFSDIAPSFEDRAGGYTRIYKLGYREADAAPMALIEWVESGVTGKEEAVAEEPAAKEKTESKDKAEAKPKAKAKAKAEAEAKAESDS